MKALAAVASLLLSTAPLFLGKFMSLLGPPMLFWSFALLCLLFAAYVSRQLRDVRAVTVEEQLLFSAASPDVAPASFDLDPRGEEHSQAGSAPVDD